MSNELSTIQASGNLSTTSTIFDDFEEFQKAYKMAEALSKTSLIPQNFQGHPEDCVIAIDYSRRLGLPPTAVMPHLYVIGGRPSLSAQFMISLVNRSGRFSRIKWRESVDGSVEFTVNREKKTLPNCSAVAYFEELATGKRYESPTVDLKFAQQNGWLVKRDKYGKDLESGWCKMPGVMARYRSAAILIKTVCPELALGMEIDDGTGGEGIADREQEPTPERRVEAVVVQNAKSDAQLEAEFYEIKDAIEQSGPAGLKLLGRQISEMNFPPAYLDDLREAFRARRATLEKIEKAGIKPTDEKPAETPAVEEPAKEESAKNDETTVDKPFVEIESLEDLIKSATSYRTINDAWLEVERASRAGRITSDRYIELEKVYKAVVDAARAANDEKERELFVAFLKDVNAAEGDKDQKTWAQELGRTISSTIDRETITGNNLNTAAEWRESGALTASLHGAVIKYANARLDALF